MNPNTGEIHHGNEEFIKALEEQEGVKFTPVPREKLSEITDMNDTQRKAWAKQERKRALRLAEKAKLGR